MKFARRKTRRAVAGIVATVIMFAILFTVGTSYFIFVSSQNSAYVSNLLSATNKAQGNLAEGLSVGTLLDSNGNIEFYANNTSSETVNMTAVLVISSTGALLSCEGVGFPAGAGCTNTTPTLWRVVNPGAGSADIDTEYVYAAGTTDTVKVLTARGNSYSATYPEPASQSTSSQAVTVSLDNLKWVQLIPQSSSLLQKKYVSNCNSASCSATYASSVNSGDLLVDGIGWASQSPPASPPTDTLNDQFTLGASSSVVVPSAASVVQSRYNSNCNAASCGLAFSSSVTSGHELVYAVGWANNSPPSSPTDTLGDTFTLGKSNSVAVVPPTPALVQDRYNSNCNSATCSLAYSSPVTAGNTLVYGLGWFGNAPYVPVTITNGGGSSSLSFDGSTGSSTEGKSASASLTTSSSNDVIILSAGTSSSSGSVKSVSDSGGHTWNTRTTTTGSSAEIEEWYTIATSPLSSDSITVTWYSSGDNTFSAFAISGANTSSPFDTNGGLPDTSSGTSTSPSVSVSTSNANDIVFGLIANEHTSSSSCRTETDANGFTDTNATQCASGSNTAQNSDQEYEIVTSTQSNLSVSFSTSNGGSNSWAMIGDAVVATASSATPNPFQEMITWNPSTYSAYESSSLGNVRFCADSACNTPLYAWLESCNTTCGPAATSATAWVKLTSSISPGGNLTIYMVFYATSTAFDGNYWGEAPELSSTYAQYDNGGNVFNAYFNGNTATGSFSAYGGYTVSKATAISGPGGATINAIKITGYAASDPMFSFSASLSNSAMVVESSFSSPGSAAPGTDTGVAGLVNSATASSVNNGISSNMGYSTSYFNQDYDSGGTVTTDQNPQGTATSSWVKATLTYGGSSSSSWSGFVAPQFYSATGGYSGTVANNPLSSASHVYMGVISSSTSTYTVTLYYDYMRARAYPPSGVMPSTNFGATVTGNGSPSTPTDTLGDTFTLGVSNSVGVSNLNYYSFIWYATAASSGSDTISVSFASTVTGSVSIYELTGYSTSGVQTSPGSSSAGSTSLSVGSFTPTSNSFVIGNAETASSSSTFTAGSGYTLVSTCAAVYGCSEYLSGSSGAKTVQMTIGASSPWAESAISFPPAQTNTYYSYIWYASAKSNAADTITATFGSTVAGSVSIYEISGVTATGLLASVGASSTSQTGTSVPSISPATGSVVIGNTETTSTTYTAGSGYTLSGSCSSVSGCGEYQTGVSSATTVPMSISPAGPWVESAVSFQPITTTYYSYIWYATAARGGSDTVTATFGASVAGSVSLYDATGYTTSGALASNGSSSTASTSAAVSSFTPASDSFIVGNVEGASGSSTFTATSGFTLPATCNSVGGCSEYSAGGGGSASTVPINIGSSTPWVESAMSFSTPFNPQSGIQVGGYPTMGVSSGASLAWEVTFTNVDPQHRSITIWPQTELAIGSAEYDGFDTDYTQAHYYIISALNPGSTTVTAYSTSSFITLAYNVPTTLYFAATAALGSTTQAFGTNVLTPFEAYFALTGTFSDGTLYGETIPYPYGIITQANAYTTPTTGASGATVTVSCTSPCHLDAGASAMVGWINSEGQLTPLTTFTVTGSGNVPSGVTFQVPSVAAGYYTIEVTDYINSVFMTFQHT
ncbi:MAG TPA: hypothetical protein VLY21_07850 [Nitrososphaerales archaeon]|nr:hypothetical protein [Nitrososphaerales archaeon]